MTRITRRNRRRRAREGAALVQALIVGLTMCITLACVMMFARAYGAKIASGQLARDAAWTYSMDGCPDGVTSSADQAAGLEQQTEDPSVGQQLKEAIFRLSPGESQPVELTADAPALLGGETIGFETVTLFSCNEPPDTNGDVFSIGAAAFRLISNIM